MPNDKEDHLAEVFESARMEALPDPNVGEDTAAIDDLHEIELEMAVQVPPNPQPPNDVAEDQEVEDETTPEFRHLMLALIVQNRKNSHFHLLLYNSITKNHNTAHAINSLIQIHSNLMTLHGLMAGFQFIAISTDLSYETPARHQHAALALLAMGFMMNATGTIISLITMEYLKSIEEETIRMQVCSILKNWSFFRFSDVFAVGAAITLVSTVNLLVYDLLPVAFCIVFNLCSIVAWTLTTILWISTVIVYQRQGGGRHIHRGIREHND